MSNRTKVNDFIRTELKKINGGISPFNPSYTFKSKLHDNVYRGLKFIDEINDFPAIYISTSKETRTYHTSGLTEAKIPVILRCYVHGDQTKVLTNNLAQDVEHVLYNMDTYSNLDLQIQDITIKGIDIDSGLMAPYGMIEIFLLIQIEI